MPRHQKTKLPQLITVIYLSRFPIVVIDLINSVLYSNVASCDLAHKMASCTQKQNKTIVFAQIQNNQTFHIETLKTRCNVIVTTKIR